jgi:cell wall-associated NlpC family hydrolase
MPAREPSAAHQPSRARGKNARQIGERIAAEALEWRGTPFAWGQSKKGIGCDCKGLVAGVFREIGLPEADSVYATFGGYRVDRAVPSALLLEGMGELFDQVAADAMEPGDLIVGKHGGKPSHLAICTGARTAVHTQIASKAYVKETDLRVLFHFYPLHSVWRRR